MAEVCANTSRITRQQAVVNHLDVSEMHEYSELQQNYPADMILYCTDHVILFAGWTNEGHTALYGMLPEYDLASL